MRIAIACHRFVEKIRRMVISVPGNEIAWIASNGLEAVERCGTDIPHLVLMALDLPIIDGVEATRRIIRNSPCLIVIMTETLAGSAARVFGALGYGALDTVNVSVSGNSAELEQSKTRLLKKLKTVQRLLNYASERKPDAFVCPLSPRRQLIPPLIAIGSSAGGPKTVARLLSQLPATLQAGVALVQHVQQEFSVGLVDWLNSQTALNVRLAVQGECPRMGSVYVAGTNNHLIISSRFRFTYTQEPRHVPYRPSVDVFFESVARHWPNKGAAVLLTGMGRDGAQGLAMLQSTGWFTIAQDQATSAVYGMPRAAKELGAATTILSIDEIGPTMSALFRK